MTSEEARPVEGAHWASHRGQAVSLRPGSSPQLPPQGHLHPPPGPTLAMLATEGRQPLCFLLSLSLTTRTAQPAESTSPGRREGPPRALLGLDSLSPAPPEWEQPGCPLPTHDCHTSHFLEPSCALPTPHGTERGAATLALPHAPTHLRLRVILSPEGVRVCLLSGEHRHPRRNGLGAGPRGRGQRPPAARRCSPV